MRGSWKDVWSCLCDLFFSRQELLQPLVCWRKTRGNEISRPGKKCYTHGVSNNCTELCLELQAGCSYDGGEVLFGLLPSQSNQMTASWADGGFGSCRYMSYIHVCRWNWLKACEQQTQSQFLRKMFYKELNSAGLHSPLDHLALVIRLCQVYPKTRMIGLFPWMG